MEDRNSSSYQKEGIYLIFCIFYLSPWRISAKGFLYTGNLRDDCVGFRYTKKKIQPEPEFPAWAVCFCVLFGSKRYAACKHSFAFRANRRLPHTAIHAKTAAGTAHHDTHTVGQRRFPGCGRHKRRPLARCKRFSHTRHPAAKRQRIIPRHCGKMQIDALSKK